MNTDGCRLINRRDAETQRIRRGKGKGKREKGKGERGKGKGERVVF
jgi:hypothetical protein